MAKYEFNSPLNLILFADPPSLVQEIFLPKNALIAWI